MPHRKNAIKHMEKALQWDLNNEGNLAGGNEKKERKQQHEQK